MRNSSTRQHHSGGEHGGPAGLGRRHTSVIAERENEVLVGKLPENAEASLPMPWPIRSWLASQRLPSRWFSILALDAISSELTSVITSAGTSRARSTSHRQPGQ